jgi:hypothetical protein
MPFFMASGNSQVQLQALRSRCICSGVHRPHEQVRYATTVLGRFGSLVAFLAELAISLVDDDHLVRDESPNPCAIYALSGGCSVRLVHNLRNAFVPDEHESRANVWFRLACQILARIVDLFRCAANGYAGRRGGIPAFSGRRSSVLRKALPRA